MIGTRKQRLPRVPLASLVAVAILLWNFVATAKDAPPEVVVRSPGEVFQDCDDCPEMVVVPPGSFTMGSPSWEPRRNSEEEPQHKVTITKPFAVSKHEVTVAQYRRFVALTNRVGARGCRVWDGRKWNGNPSLNWRDPGFAQHATHPVTCISWHDAKAYAEWLSSITRKEYRLLSESEWEYATRANTTTPFYFGATVSSDQANYNGNYVYGPGQRGHYRRRTVAVGGFPANAFGLHDLHGNVWEWVEDCWHKDYRNAPSTGKARRDSGNCSLRAIRGGTWNGGPWTLRSANRAKRPLGRRYHNLGFRVARELAPG